MKNIPSEEAVMTAIPLRKEIAPKDTWDLSKLFSGDDEWYGGLSEYENRTKRIGEFKGTLGTPESLGAWLDFYRDLGILEERLGYYSELRQTEDEGDAAARTMSGKFLMASSGAAAAASWVKPELMAVPEDRMAAALAHPRLGEYRVYLTKLLRFKPHILGAGEERIAALEAEGDEVPNDVFSALTNVDMDFGFIDTPEGKRPLSQSSFPVFMENPDRELRRRAYKAFYQVFGGHKTTLASLYGGSVKKDVIRARIRNFPSARAASLFADDVKVEVYDNLINTVSANLGPLHRYYGL
ncbi:MAG: M3 family metallopeptidase, partial [Treponema sp.]|nr:M3 family metallopeptidase [Treponema sp.]